MFSIFTIGTIIRKLQHRNKQLNLYYPKGVYEPTARREMKVILTQFNDIFYDAYPEKLKEQTRLIINEKPRAHSKKYEVQRDLALYRTQKVRKKELAKIGEYLNLKYIAEEQMASYNQALKKAVYTKGQLSQERFSEFFPELFESRIDFLDMIKQNCLQKIDELTEEKKTFERTINDLVHHPQSFWADAGRLLSGIVADSVKHVVDHTLRKKW